jgi:GTP-binding protein HflX
VPVVALVGYTNAGKSTLFNQLTGARVSTADRLFATLDPTLRRLELDGGERMILADTVGFISHLPHELVAAFRATLEETRRASLLLHVIDASDARREDKIIEVNAVLREIDAGEIPQIRVYNKIDCCDLDGSALNEEACTAMPNHDGDNGYTKRAWVSARESVWLDVLTGFIREHFRVATVQHRLRLPSSAGRLRARLYELGAVIEERIEENGDWLMDVAITPASLERLSRREGLVPALISTVSGGENRNIQTGLAVADTSKAS